MHLALAYLIHMYKFLFLLNLDYERCLLVNTDIKGVNLENEASIREETIAKCHQRCLAHPKCLVYSYLTKEHSAAAYRKNCYLKAESIKGNTQRKFNVVSGPRLCIMEFWINYYVIKLFLANSIITPDCKYFTVKHNCETKACIQ